MPQHAEAKQKQRSCQPSLNDDWVCDEDLANQRMQLNMQRFSPDRNDCSRRRLVDLLRGFTLCLLELARGYIRITSARNQQITAKRLTLLGVVACYGSNNLVLLASDLINETFGVALCLCSLVLGVSLHNVIRSSKAS